MDDLPRLLRAGGVDPTHEAWIGMQIVGAVFGVCSAILLTRSVRIGLCVDADGALIRNMLRTRHLAWSQIDRFELRPARGPGSTPAVSPVSRTVDW